jgi:hypothetical protein
MAEQNGCAELRFTNPILIDIFSHYAENSEMAAFISPSGEIDMRFRLNDPTEPPKTCEQVLSLFYALLESNPESPAGRVFMRSQREILRETVYRLMQVIDGFGSVKVSLSTGQGHTEFTITRTKTVQ